jgi:hypothetical protein
MPVVSNDNALPAWQRDSVRGTSAHQGARVALTRREFMQSTVIQSRSQTIRHVFSGDELDTARD